MVNIFSTFFGEALSEYYNAGHEIVISFVLVVILFLPLFWLIPWLGKKVEVDGELFGEYPGV